MNQKDFSREEKVKAIGKIYGWTDQTVRWYMGTASAARIDQEFGWAVKEDITRNLERLDNNPWGQLGEKAKKAVGRKATTKARGRQRPPR